MKKTKKIKDGYGDKKFISSQEYEAIRFIDNGGKPNSNKKKTYKTVVKEYKRHFNLLIIWFIHKYPILKANISKKIKVKNSTNSISSKLNKIGWKKIQKIYEICLEYSKQRRTRKLVK